MKYLHYDHGVQSFRTFIM